MIRIEDERLQFYLRHQDLIDAWALLAKLIPSQAHDFLVSCKGDLERLALELGADVKCEYWKHKTYPMYSFFRPVWTVAPRWAHAEWPPVGVGLQWVKPRVAFKGEHAPLTGIWLCVDTDGTRPDDELLAAFHSRCATPRDGFAKRDPWGAAVRRISPPNDAYWDDLEPFKCAIVDSIRSAWRHYADDISEVIRTTYA